MKVRVFCVCLVAVVLAAAAGLYETHGPATHYKHSARSAYTTTDVVEFLAFAQGPVAMDHPALALPPGDSVRHVRPAQLRAIAESVSGCIRAMDAGAGPALTEAFNATDPQRLDSAVHRFNAASKRWLSAPYSQEAPCPPPPPPPSAPPSDGGGSGWWKVKGDILAQWLALGVVAVAAGVSVTVGAVFHLLVLAMGALVVAETAVVVLWLFPAMLSYEFENTPSELDRQTAIAKIVGTLRS